MAALKQPNSLSNSVRMMAQPILAPSIAVKAARQQTTFTG
jgi:hypothetical protein